MPKVKKSLSLIIALGLMTTVVFTGCNGNGSSSSTPESASGDTTTAADTTAASENNSNKEPVTLEFWCVGNAQDGNERVEAAVNDYLKNELKSNISINYEILGWGDTYTPKANNALQTGQTLDLCFTSSWAANYQDNARKGYFLDLTPYFTKYPGIEKALGKDFMLASSIDGKAYGLPTNKEQAHYWGMLLRKDLVDKYKIDVTKIKTMKDLEPYFDQIKKGEGITPIAMGGQDVAQWKFLDWDVILDDDVPGALSPKATKENKTIVNSWVTDEAVAVYNEMADYLKKGYISADYTSTTQDVPTLLKTGKFFAAVSSLKPCKAEEMKATTGGIDWVQVGMTDNVMTNRETTGALMAIPATSQHPDEAMEIINLLYTDAKFKNLLIYGEEGKDYTVGSDKRITKVEGSDYFPGDGWKFGDQIGLDQLMDNEALDKWTQFAEMNKSAKPLVSLGFMFNSTDTKIQTLIANTRAVTAEYYKSLLGGQAKDVKATVDAMNKKFEAAGSADLIKEMQTQFDAWIAKK